MITYVARLTGRAVGTIAREPYALTLWTFHQLRDQERMDRLLARAHRLDTAVLTNYALLNPGELATERRALDEALADERAPRSSDYSREELVEASRQIFEQMTARFAAAGKPLPPHNSEST